MMLFQVAAVIALALSSQPAEGAKKEKRDGVEIIVLEKARECVASASPGDNLAVHYVGKLKDGTVFDEGTQKVGRPLQFNLGEGSVIQGWHIGIEGMCLGEKRRLVIPPRHGYGDEGMPQNNIPGGATLVFDIELVLLNGQNAIFLSEEEYCDGCKVVVEQFYAQWTDVMNKQMAQIKQSDGGNRPPSITYNDDTEAMVQGFCSSKSISSPKVAPFVKQTCDTIMHGWKRELVGKFLSETVELKMVPDKKVEVCRDMIKACPGGMVIEAPPNNSCESCVATVAGLMFDLRTQGPLRAAQGTSRQVYDTMEYLCMMLHLRLPKATKTQEMCDDIVDEHGPEIVSAIDKGDSWGDITRLVCSKLNNHCKREKFKDEL